MSKLTRRNIVGLAAVLAVMPGAVFAVTEKSAMALVDKVVHDINTIINSGKPEAAMIGDFESIFVNYAHVDVIARYVLGPDARSLSGSKFDQYQDAFQGYISRKYGRRFREFIGGKVEVTGASKKKKFVEVDTVATLAGMAPFEVGFMVSEFNGRERFHDMSIEGVSVLSLEQSEIQAMLDANKGNIDALIKVLKKA